MAQNPFLGGKSSHYYVEEVTPGVTPPNPVWTKIRYTGGFPALTKDTLINEELDGSFEVTSIRTGNEQVTGEFSTNLAQTSQDELLASALSSSWVAGDSEAGIEVTVADATKTFTRTAGDFTLNTEVGDLVQFPGLTGNNSKPFIATVVTPTVITGGAITLTLTDETATTDYATGDRLVPGNECRTFSVLTWLVGKCGTVEKYILTTGVEFGSFSIETAVNANVTGSFPFIGRGQEIDAALPAGSTFSPDDDTKQFTGVDGKVNKDGQVLSYVTTLTVASDSQASAQFELGSKFAAFVERGNFQNTISGSAFMQDVDLLNQYVNETEVKIDKILSGPDGAMSFTVPHTVLTAVTPEIGGPTSVTQSIEGQGVGGTNDPSLIIQRITLP